MEVEDSTAEAASLEEATAVVIGAVVGALLPIRSREVHPPWDRLGDLSSPSISRLRSRRLMGSMATLVATSGSDTDALLSLVFFLSMFRAPAVIRRRARVSCRGRTMYNSILEGRGIK